tara:strand:+ start:194 stop:514 length:321 start_codon:yes stop_codon:yes gene_type:complete
MELNKIISIGQAIVAIKEDAQTSILGDDINRITWHDDNPTNITNQQILDKQAELQADYDAKQYQRDRAKAYPAIGDQLDMQYWDKINNTSTWQDAVQAVKDAHPKP